MSGRFGRNKRVHLERFFDVLRKYPEGEVNLIPFSRWRRYLKTHPHGLFEPIDLSQYHNMWVITDKFGNKKGWLGNNVPEFAFLLSLDDYPLACVQEACYYALGSKCYVGQEWSFDTSHLQRNPEHWELKQPHRDRFIHVMKEQLRREAIRHYQKRWVDLVKTVPTQWHLALCNRMQIKSLDRIPSDDVVESLVERFEAVSKEQTTHLVLKS